MQFTTRHLLFLVFILAASLGGMFWLSRMFAIDADSEAFLLLGQPMQIVWQEGDWEPTSSTFTCDMLPLTSESNAAGPSNLSLEQELFECSYVDYFGSEAFEYNYSITGHRNEDWTEYMLLPIGSGGGNTDGSIQIKSKFDATTKTLRIELRQSFRSSRTAKEAEFTFRYVDDKFELQQPIDDAT